MATVRVDICGGAREGKSALITSLGSGVIGDGKQLAVVEAANAFGRFFNGQITAAGKVPPIAIVGTARTSALRPMRTIVATVSPSPVDPPLDR